MWLDSYMCIRHIDMSVVQYIIQYNVTESPVRYDINKLILHVCLGEAYDSRGQTKLSFLSFFVIHNLLPKLSSGTSVLLTPNFLDSLKKSFHYLQTHDSYVFSVTFRKRHAKTKSFFSRGDGVVAMMLIKTTFCCNVFILLLTIQPGTPTLNFKM